MPVNEGETEAETVTEQAEESGAVEKLEGFQYQITFDVDGTQKSIGFNTPEGYEVEGAAENYYKFVNANNDYFSIAPFTLDGYGEEALAAYDNYLYQNGYDKRIIAAVYEIPVDADEEQIARIITGKK